MSQSSEAKSSSARTQEKILEIFTKKAKTRLTPAEIQRRGAFGRDALQSIVDALRDLCRAGRLVRLKKNHYALPDRQNLVTGKVHAHPDGYGFLLPEDKDAQKMILAHRSISKSKEAPSIN